MTEEIRFVSESTVEVYDHAGTDLAPIHTARVSTGAQATWGFGPSEEGLMGYLLRERHASPFEHAWMSFLIETPIFVAREFMRHRTLSFNEESGRYRQMRPVFYVPPVERPLTQVGKAAHYELHEGSLAQRFAVIEAHEQGARAAYALYLMQLELGVAREVARGVLPTSLITRFYASGNLRAWLNFLSLRTAPNALFEIRAVASSIEECVQMKFPHIHAAWVTEAERGQL